MPGIANERGLTPFFDVGLAVSSGGDSGAGASAETLPRPAGAVMRFGAIRRHLDSIGGLGWSVIGFVGGAVFWHFVGFWGFMSSVVLADGPLPAAERPVLSSAPFQARSQWVQVAEAGAPRCTRLALDRSTGLTVALPCDAHHPPLRADAFQGREDLLAPRGAGSPVAGGGQD